MKTPPRRIGAVSEVAGVGGSGPGRLVAIDRVRAVRLAETVGDVLRRLGERAVGGRDAIGEGRGLNRRGHGAVERMGVLVGIPVALRDPVLDLLSEGAEPGADRRGV